jgi:hypothetical protein
VDLWVGIELKGNGFRIRIKLKGSGLRSMGKMV